MVKPSKKEVTSNVNKRKSDSSDQNINQNNRMKLDHCELKVGNRVAVKTSRFTTEYLKREDFTSDEAWIKFVRHTIYKRQESRRVRQKSRRKIVTMKTFKDMLNNLKSKYFISDSDLTNLQDYKKIVAHK
ncbi:uncharacterized protein LOC106636409 [Copidosoma floridanum]|uniref:uncharacterized protein LOC106636409 n=1 Tax=Copidosoma floridanum TaxID=29053 RepID=UPI0006C974DE|nr:uncharacterized protein LOC106636409 [Copidosoma floridanum]